MNSLQIRSYRAGDEAAILSLHNRVFAQKRNMEQWQWQYRDLPGGEPIIKLACSGSEVIGHFAILPYPTFCQKRLILSGKAEAAMIKPEYRYQAAYERLFAQLVQVASEEAFARGINLIWGLSNKTRDFVNAGFVLSGTIVTRSREMSAPSLMNHFLKTIARKAGRREFFSCLTPLFRHGVASLARNGGPTHSLPSVQKFNGAPVESIGSYPACDDRITLVRDPAFLRWRFVRNPFTRSVIYVANDSGHPAGYMVSSLTTVESHQKAYILDYYALAPDHEETIHALLQHTILDVSHSKPKVIITWTDGPPNSPKQNPFFRDGIFLAGSSINLFTRVNPLCIDEAFASDIRNWSITMAFTEGRNG